MHKEICLLLILFTFLSSLDFSGKLQLLFTGKTTRKMAQMNTDGASREPLGTTTNTQAELRAGLEPSEHSPKHPKLLYQTDYKISHIFREGNQAADFLANQACTTQQYCILFEEDLIEIVRGTLSLPCDIVPATEKLLQHLRFHGSHSVAGKEALLSFKCRKRRAVTHCIPGCVHFCAYMFIGAVTHAWEPYYDLLGAWLDSSYKGELGIIYSTEETAELVAHLKFELVGKFTHGLSNLNFLRIHIVKLGLKGNVTVWRLNFKHVLIRLSNEEDFSRIWLRSEWTFDSFHMRVFKWTPNFDPQIESPIAPVWIRLPALPVHLFEKNALFTLATKIGKPLRMDEPTADLSRPVARVCV
ncbi:hypothetical protein Sango_3045000 [Sesamum angolense]|uniref:DUF4283 domain-containing protein n=1 Tax=Sesamum angolense TaxID=2727404 RepID=A0AAE1TAD5_9LAMI|nr:hypothetical protein Sango_3045000 [Sesamum angolense]